jgi:hypothetical protein
MSGLYLVPSSFIHPLLLLLLPVSRGISHRHTFSGTSGDSLSVGGCRIWFRKPELWTWCFVTLGLALRWFHYWRDPSMWHDEAALVLNVLGKSFGEMFGPLFFNEAAPPFYLVIERAACLIGDDSTLVLRLLSFLASCLALILMAYVARSLLSAASVPWATLLMACSDRLLWHSCEAKPYAIDVCCAAVLAAVYCRTNHWPLTRQFLAYGLVAPAFIFLSFPACFVFGAVVLILLPSVWRVKTIRTWVAFGLFNTVLASSFAALYFGPIQAQRCGPLTECWEYAFANWDRWWTVPWWTLGSTLDVVRYDLEPTGHALGALAGLGGIFLWRAGRRKVVVLLLTPSVLGVLAAYCHAYPWAGARVDIYTLPATALLIAAAVPPLWTYLWPRLWPGAVLLAVLVLAPLELAIYRTFVVWPRADCHAAAAYVLAHRQPTEPVAATHWEYRYYFRNMEPGLIPMDELSSRREPLRWWVIVDSTYLGRKARAHYFPHSDWSIRDERHFEHMIVYCLQPRHERQLLASLPSLMPGRLDVRHGDEQN